MEKAGKGVTNRRVFIASDDPSVFTECRESYPDFEFLGNEEVKGAMVKGGVDYGKRWSLEGLLGNIHKCPLFVTPRGAWPSWLGWFGLEQDGWGVPATGSGSKQIAAFKIKLH